MENKLTVRKIIERFAYGCGDFGCNILYVAMSTFLVFYYTDYAHVSSLAVGTIMLVSRIFDGISDIIMGVLVDRTNSRFGKARPWLLRMCIPFAISGVLLFSVPTSWTNTAKLVYIFITYNLMSTVFYTAINVPYSALNALMTQNPYERSVLSIFRNLMATAGTLIINTFTLPLVEAFGNNASAWTKAFIVLGAFAVIAFLINFAGTKERVKSVASVEEGQTEKIPVLVGIKALFQNKYWIMMTVILCVFWMMYSITAGTTTYFAKDILGNVDLIAEINSIQNVATIACMFITAGFVKKYGKRNIFCVGLAAQGVGLLILSYLGGNYTMIIVSSIIRGIGGSCVGATMWAMVSDTVDYGEWKTGYRTEGLINSASSFGYKVGSGIGSAVLGFILEVGGYSGEAVVQSTKAITSINICYIWIPIVTYIIALIIMYFYHLDKEFEGIVEELDQRRGNL